MYQGKCVSIFPFMIYGIFFFCGLPLAVVFVFVCAAIGQASRRLPPL